MSFVAFWLLKAFRTTKGTKAEFLNPGRVHIEKEGFKWKLRKKVKKGLLISVCLFL